MAAEAANPDRNEPKRIEPNRAREVELREGQLGAPNSSTNPDLGCTKRTRIEAVVVAGAGDLRAGSGESFLIGGFLAPSPFFPFDKIGVRVFARNCTRTRTNEYVNSTGGTGLKLKLKSLAIGVHYRTKKKWRKGKESRAGRQEEGIFVHAKEWRGGKERDARVMRRRCCCCCKGAAACVRGSTNAFLLHLHPLTHLAGRPARGVRASQSCLRSLSRWAPATWAQLSATGSWRR